MIDLIKLSPQPEIQICFDLKKQGRCCIFFNPWGNAIEVLMPLLAAMASVALFHQRQLNHFHKIPGLHAAEIQSSGYGQVLLVSSIPGDLKMSDRMMTINECFNVSPQHIVDD